MTQLPNYCDRMLLVRLPRMNFRSHNVQRQETVPTPRFVTSHRRTRMMSRRQFRMTMDLIALVLLNYHLGLIVR